MFYYYKIQFRIPVDVKQKFLTERQYIVFESSLFSLLKECPVCHSPVTLSSTTNGTLVKVTRECASCSHNNVWHSQTIINDYPAGNLLMSTGILSAGLLPQKAIRLFEFMNCATISRRTFFRHQKHLLHPAISTVWTNQQFQMLSVLLALGQK